MIKDISIITAHLIGYAEVEMPYKFPINCHVKYITFLNNEESFNIWGTGKPLREFLYVDDLSYAIDFFIRNDIFEGLYNVGSGEEISIFNLVEKIKKIVSYNGDLSFDSSKPDGNPRKLLNSSKIFELGWKPKFSLDEGLKNTYEWYLKNI